MRLRNMLLSFCLGVTLLSPSLSLGYFQNGKYKALSLIKEMAHSAATLLRENGQDEVQDHHVFAAAMLAVRDIYNHPRTFDTHFSIHVRESPRFFFDGIHERIQSVMALTQTTVQSGQASEISSPDEITSAWNEAVFGSSAIHTLRDFLPDQTCLMAGEYRFAGEYIITRPGSLEMANELSENERVNVIFSLDDESASVVADNARATLDIIPSYCAFTIGDFSATLSTERRHVSLAFGVRYSENLQNYVDLLNRQEAGAVNEIQSGLIFAVPLGVSSLFSAFSPLTRDTLNKTGLGASVPG